MTVSRVGRLDLRYEPAPWGFAEQRRAEIDAHFAEAQRANPKLWNGCVLLLRDYAIEKGIFRGTFFETDYASFHAWLRWDRPEANAYDCFGAAAVQASDGAFLMAEMAAHTANAGRVYFPCGTPDLSDVRDNKVDFDRSTSRELFEETGLDATEFDAAQEWTIVEEVARVVAFKTLQARDTGAALRRRVEDHIAGEPHGELAAVRLVRSRADLTPAMPDYIAAFLAHIWPPTA
jgi:8-oxo-dGTP pyrophosphatase MutT (NUDIX family)